MLGWQIYIHRRLPEQSLEEATRAPETLLAAWQTSMGGLDWVYELVKEGKAQDLGGTGYPCLYSSVAKYVLPKISSGPPNYDSQVVIGDDYVLPPGWIGDAKIYHKAIAECLPNEELIIEAWDQS